jgi:PilZ domain
LFAPQNYFLSMKTASVTPKIAPAGEFSIPVSLRLVDEMQQETPAYIRRVNAGFFLIAAPVAVKPERRVEVLFDTRRIDCQVVYCHAGSGGQYHLGVRMTTYGEALRAEPRIPVDLVAKLHIAGMEDAVSGRAVDISASGLGLLLERAVPADEPAYAELEIGFAFGEIRYCTKTTGGYRVGMKLEEFLARQDEVLAARKRSDRQANSLSFTNLFRRKN